jgi:acyl carrier protein
LSAPGRSTADRVRDLIADQLGQPRNTAHDDCTLRGDLGADSLDIVEVVMALEEDFELEIPDEDATRVFDPDAATVGDIVRYIEQRLAVRG